MANPHGVGRDWLLSILVPTVELRDALIADVAHGIEALTEAPIVAVRSIAVVDKAREPTLTMHIRTRHAVSGGEAKAISLETMHRYAPGLDLSAVTIIVRGRPKTNRA